MLINPIIIFLLILITQNVWTKTDIRSKEENCLLEHNGQILHEGDIIESNNKVYKVEDCALHRAYHVCGPHIMFIVNMVCQAIERHEARPTTTNKRRFSRFVQQKLLTEACCQNLCTISEITRYCPQ